MIMSWNNLNKEEQRAVEEKFTGLSAADAIYRRVNDEDRERRYGFGDIYQFATDAAFEMTSGLQDALRQDGKLQSALDQLLSSRVIYQFPRAAAASSGGLNSREGDGFSIHIKESRAENGQVYVIVKMDDSFDTEPQTLMLKNEQGDYLKKGLPLSVDGTFQFLAEEDEEFILSLRDAGTEVFLN